MDEKQAIQRLKQGDIGGLEFLVARHQVKAMRAAYLITRDLGLAEEVVQESFLRAFHAIRGFDESRPFEPWLLRIVVNASVKVIQRSARQIPVGEEEDEALFM
jgi:RNA polymerase sigma-70 factor (ECF subfamily)